MKFTEFFSGLGHHVIYYPSWNAMTGGTTATILLANFFQWTGSEKDSEGWIYKNRKDIFDETGLSRYEQESARAALVSRNLLFEEYRGIPRRLFYKVNMDELNSRWENRESLAIPTTNKKVSFPPTGGDESGSLLGEKPPTRRRKTDQQVGEKTTNKEAENQPSITTVTTEVTQRTRNTPQTPRDFPSLQEEGGGSFPQTPEPRPLGTKIEAHANQSASRPSPSPQQSVLSPPAVAPPPSDLARFVHAYPEHRRHADRQDIIALWRGSEARRPPIDALLFKLAEQTASHQWTKEGGQYVPGIMKYLKDEGWKAPIMPPPEPRYKSAADWNSAKSGELVL